MSNQIEEQTPGYYLSSSISDHLRKQITGGEVVDSGATFKPKGKDISKGCKACKSGKWICIYLTYECDLKCKFCPQNRSVGANNKFGAWDPWGDTPTPKSFKDRTNLILEEVKGISFSGGEPLMQLESISTKGQTSSPTILGVYSWLDIMNNEINWKERPYIWIYTNGNRITERVVNELADRGVREIRLNLAASNYSEDMIKKMETIRKRIDYLAVEVPVLSWQMNNLIRSLKQLEGIGVDYLNLHELFVTKYNLDYLLDCGLIDENLLYSNGVARTDTINHYYLPSIIDVYSVIRYIDDNRLNLIYNDCSSRNTRLQMLGRHNLRRKSVSH